MVDKEEINNTKHFIDMERNMSLHKEFVVEVIKELDEAHKTGVNTIDIEQERHFAGLKVNIYTSHIITLKFVLKSHYPV